MQLILHAGAHCTDDDRLLRTLVKNGPAMRPRGVAIPKPRTYRRPLNEAMNALTGAQPAPDALEVMMATLMGGDTDPVDRLILSSENFFTVPKLALRDGQIYPRAGERLRNLHKLFRDCDISLFIGLRNPATWLPAVYATTPHRDFLDFLRGSAPRLLRWSELIQRIREDTPGVAITVWCNEDTPLIWGAVARSMLGLAPDTKIKGAFDQFGDIITREGMQRFRDYLRVHPDLTEMQKRRVMEAFLAEFALSAEIEEVIDMPGWTVDFVAQMNAAYQDDMRRIAQMPGVEFLLP